MVNRRMKYCAKFKLEVAKFAEDSNNSAASRAYGVSEKCVRNWRKQSSVLREMPKGKFANRRRDCYWPELEKELLDVLNERRRNGLSVTRRDAIKQAIDLARKKHIENFTASKGWYTRFLHRNGLNASRKQTASNEEDQDHAAKDSETGENHTFLYPELSELRTRLRSRLKDKRRAFILHNDHSYAKADDTSNSASAGETGAMDQGQPSPGGTDQVPAFHDLT